MTNIKRTKRVYIRLNDTEMEIFRNKAKNYTQMSSMIRAAVNQFNDAWAIRRLDALNELSGLIRSFGVELSKIGGNVNQVAKRANELVYAGELNQEYYDKVVLPTVEEIQKMMLDVKDQQSQILNKLIK